MAPSADDTDAAAVVAIADDGCAPKDDAAASADGSRETAPKRGREMLPPPLTAAVPFPFKAVGGSSDAVTDFASCSYTRVLPVVSDAENNADDEDEDEDEDEA